MKQKAYAGQNTGQAASTLSSTAPEHDKVGIHVAMILVWAAVGLIIPRASIYGGLAPFGVGLATAVSGPGAILVYLSVCAGYLINSGALFPIRYIAAVAISAGIRWTFSGIPRLSRGRILPSVATCLSVAIAGVVSGFTSGTHSTLSTLILICESIIAGGFCYFCAVTADFILHYRQQPLSVQEQAAFVITSSMVIISLASLSFGGISPGRIAAVVAILIMARAGREQSGCLAGVVLGVALALTNPTAGFLAIAYSFGGLLAGMFSRFSRFAAAGAFIIANTILIILPLSGGADQLAIAGLYEAAAGSLLFVLLPNAVPRAVSSFFTRGQQLPAVEGLRRSVVMRLNFSAKAIADVAGTVDVVSKNLARLGAPDLGTVYRNASGEICRRCGKRSMCWDSGKGFSDTMASFNDMSPILRQHGSIDRSQVTGHLQRNCTQLDALLDKVNSEYSEYLIREGAFRRLADIRTVAVDQFVNTAELLTELANDFSRTEQVDEEAAVRVQEVCEQHHILVRDVVCLLDREGRMKVELMTDSAGEKRCENNQDWLADVAEACGRIFDQPVITSLPSLTKIVLQEVPVYYVETAVTQLNCDGEKLCGDAVEIFTGSDGRATVVLSDGMGSGGRAAVDGAMSAIMASRLLQAGLTPDTVLRMVNAALMVKCGDESLVTLDILSVNLYNGQMESLKAGAAASLLLSKGRVSRLERSSLPVGILRDIQFERQTDTLGDGDLLLMMSDGALSGGLGAVEEILQQFDPVKTSLKSLTQTIAHYARERQVTRQDDVSVVALMVHRRSA